MPTENTATEPVQGGDDPHALADVYGFLALCMRYPDPVFFDQEFLTAFQGLLQTLNWDSRNQEITAWLKDDHHPIDTLQIEYTRLFINGVPHVAAPPYGSIYVGGAASLQGKLTEQTRDFYRECGFDLSDETEPADHIQHELEFLSQLTRSGLLAKEEEFLRRLFRPWFKKFHKRVHEKARHPFYLVSVELIDFFTKEEP